MKFLKEERGYTLLETVIAMALLSGVLIPVGIVIGNFMLDRRGTDLHSALRVAESEMTRVVTTRAYSSESSLVSEFPVERTIRRNGYVVRITIAVSTDKKPATRLCVLHKSVLDYE